MRKRELVSTLEGVAETMETLKDVLEGVHQDRAVEVLLQIDGLIEQLKE